MGMSDLDAQSQQAVTDATRAAPSVVIKESCRPRPCNIP
jgi:hypothetical protein